MAVEKDRESLGYNSHTAVLATGTAMGAVYIQDVDPGLCHVYQVAAPLLALEMLCNHFLSTVGRALREGVKFSWRSRNDAESSYEN